jgi:hypothetical protein
MTSYSVAPTLNASRSPILPLPPALVTKFWAVVSFVSDQFCKLVSVPTAGKSRIPKLKWAAAVSRISVPSVSLVNASENFYMRDVPPCPTQVHRQQPGTTPIFRRTSRYYKDVRLGNCIMKNTVVRGKSDTRDFIARLTAISVVAGLSCSTILGFADGNFQKLQAVWAIAGPYIGYIFATYMTSGEHGGSDR